MTERVSYLLNLLKSKEYKKMRKKGFPGFSPDATSRELFCMTMKWEEPVCYKQDRIGFYRCYSDIPKISKQGNTVPCYGYYLENGFDAVYRHMKAEEAGAEGERLRFIRDAIAVIESVYAYCERYRKKATGDLKKALETVPQNRPTNYHEALVMLKIILYTLRCNQNPHITLGRFDQYMYPFFQADRERGMSREELLELTEEFFLSINFDTDLYHGVQLGDNGQSMMLGGYHADGVCCFNELSEICMQASMELNLIDPKINLRVSKETPKEIYRLGTKMTKQGMGFPQYSNDDVVIPGLLKLGYASEDAYNYSVAACWEFIVPDAFDVPNIAAFNFPEVVNRTVYERLKCAETFDEFLIAVKQKIKEACGEYLIQAEGRICMEDCYYSLFFESCVKHCMDYTTGTVKYYNYGFHGVGISSAADALAAIKKKIYEEKSLEKQELIDALYADFDGYPEIQEQLLNCPKMGNNDDYADTLAGVLMESFSECLSNLRNHWGGRIRPGTGSAHEYLCSAVKVGATADGRCAYTPYGSSFSPAITTKLNGPLSVIQSFTKFDMTKIINGGPLTLEIHDTTFRNEQGEEKVAELVRIFIELGGHQLQLNAINRERLLEAQKHPEKHPNLIVRVWGWSGYFNELAEEFQNHVIARTEFRI